MREGFEKREAHQRLLHCYHAIMESLLLMKTHTSSTSSISEPRKHSGRYLERLGITFTLWLFNVAMENGPFIDGFPIKTSIYGGFSMAMLNNQMVLLIFLQCGEAKRIAFDRHLNAPGPTSCAWLGGVTSSMAWLCGTPWTSAGVLLRSEIDGSRDGSPTFFEVPLSSTKCPMPRVRTMQNGYPFQSVCSLRSLSQFAPWHRYFISVYAPENSAPCLNSDVRSSRILLTHRVVKASSKGHKHGKMVHHSHDPSWSITINHSFFLVLGLRTSSIQWLGS